MGIPRLLDLYIARVHISREILTSYPYLNVVFAVPELVDSIW